MEGEPKNPEHKLEKAKIWNPFECIAAIRSRIANTFATTEPNPDTGVYIPESINHELQYNQGNVRRETFASVAGYPGFEDLSAALTMKMLNGHPKQRALLKEMTTGMRNGTYDELRQELHRKYLAEPGAATEVKAAKIAQVFRMGPYAFHEKFNNLILKVKHEGKIPCLIAHSALLGLRSAVAHAKNGDHIVIVNPENLEHNNGEHCGYIITVQEEDCDVVDLHTTTDVNLLLPSAPAVLIDDTIKNGTTSKHVRDAFAKKLHFPTIEEDPIAVVYSGRQND